MTRTIRCHHEKARFYAVQQLGRLEPVELWHCPDCRSTISVDGVRQAAKRPAAAS